jgi:hypothetical protein
MWLSIVQPTTIEKNRPLSHLLSVELDVVRYICRAALLAGLGEINSGI